MECRAKRRSLAVATRWWLLKALIRQLNSAEQARVTRLQPSAPGVPRESPGSPPPWPPRPIFLAHFLHPPGGSLHCSVPESVILIPMSLQGTGPRLVCTGAARCSSFAVSQRLKNLAVSLESTAAAALTPLHWLSVCQVVERADLELTSA